MALAWDQRHRNDFEDWHAWPSAFDGATVIPGFCLLLESDPGTGVDEILLEDLSGCILQQDAP